MKTIVIYHSADFDGIFCREIARKFLGENEVEYIGWNYGDPWILMPEEGLVYLLDLSPECLDASGIQGTYWNRIVWIDHHKTAIDKFQPPSYPNTIGYRIDGVAACRLTWQWFKHDLEYLLTHHLKLPAKQDYVDRSVSEPRAVRLAGEYDIWDKRDPDAELFQHGLRSMNIDKCWPALLCEEGDGRMVDRLVENGQALQYARTNENTAIIKSYGFDLEFEGLKFLACNHARYNSHLFTAGLKPEHDACFGFKWDGKKSVWEISLYHAPGKEQHDLSQIAVKHGGGGHRGACGFRLKTLPWL